MQFTSVLLLLVQCQHCQHFCNEKFKCGCNEGYTLSTDKQSCIKCADVHTGFHYNQGNTLTAIWHVTICNKIDKSVPLVCSGSLVNDQWIITSAKCVCNTNTDKNYLSLKLKKSRTCAIKEDGELGFSISEIYCHPNHNSSYGKQIDLALMKADSRIPVENLNKVKPLCLEKADNIDELYEYTEASRTFYIYGLGNPERTVKDNATLVATQVSLAPHFSCLQQFYSEGTDYNGNPSIFCMYSTNPEACVADLGSAIINANVNGKMIFAGVTSSFTEKCGVQDSLISCSKIQDLNVLEWASNIIAE